MLSLIIVALICNNVAASTTGNTSSSTGATNSTTIPTIPGFSNFTTAEPRTNGTTRTTNDYTGTTSSGEPNPNATQCRGEFKQYYTIPATKFLRFWHNGVFVRRYDDLQYMRETVYIREVQEQVFIALMRNNVIGLSFKHGAAAGEYSLRTDNETTVINVTRTCSDEPSKEFDIVDHGANYTCDEFQYSETPTRWIFSKSDTMSRKIITSYTNLILKPAIRDYDQLQCVMLFVNNGTSRILQLKTIKPIYTEALTCDYGKTAWYELPKDYDELLFYKDNTFVAEYKKGTDNPFTKIDTDKIWSHVNDNMVRLSYNADNLTLGLYDVKVKINNTKYSIAAINYTFAEPVISEDIRINKTTINGIEYLRCGPESVTPLVTTWSVKYTNGWYCTYAFPENYFEVAFLSDCNWEWLTCVRTDTCKQARTYAPSPEEMETMRLAEQTRILDEQAKSGAARRAAQVAAQTAAAEISAGQQISAVPILLLAAMLV